jgi:SNF2 family DNA or RNA helicase
LELGVVIKGEKINLLPLLQKIIQQIKNNELNISEKESIQIKLPDGRYINVPAERVKNISNVLIELYDKEALNSDDVLQLSRLHASRLLELEKALGATQLRWFGGEKLRALGQKLTNFKGIKKADVPKEFKAKLRPYQLEGLSWLQFLREYELGGVLADDMGLGKTIQALAHITLEKKSGRMKTPSLVIAPTSLMFNWRMEAEKFSPELKVLVLHGADRKQNFDNMTQYDLILTTYPLIVRDKDILLKQIFHLLILDEAQFIKNSKNLATQISLQIKANHRVCLTGTPMENHLGELWSLFHFMMPGLLGDEKTFSRVFRTPIEKHADNERRLQLNKRIAPFLLRRTKDKVVKELPPKVDMLRHVELENEQRDLYETIRLTMQKKVKDEIAKLGLSRSHIIILDALLKLRQVCCDPRLLKMDSSKKDNAKSAKLELLMSLIPELLDEGRKILLFSQFTEMLGLIEQELKEKNIAYVKLTGQTVDRETPIKAFQEGKVPLFLISLKAGGTGLNLTAADTVIHYDPWWNPAVENQATDRAHRIGQNKTVFVYKFVTKGTVEEKILEMQNNKRALMEGLFSENTTKKFKLSDKDLQDLFEPLS